jgi:hypothetical protein
MEKISLGPLSVEKKTLVVAAGAVTAMFILLFAVYFPLASRMGRSSREFSELQGELISARALVGSYQGDPAESLPMPERSEVPTIVDEITKLGKTLDMDFRAIRPGGVKVADSGHGFLPIEIRVESSYENLGVFVGSLREMKSGFIRVNQFEIFRNEDILPHVESRFGIDILLKGSFGPVE